jgi:hypothetical protein
MRADGCQPRIAALELSVAELQQQRLKLVCQRILWARTMFGCIRIAALLLTLLAAALCYSCYNDRLIEKISR